MNTKEVLKVFSLLFLLKERRAKAFPFILAIIELLLDKYENRTTLVTELKLSLDNILDEYFLKNSENLYDLLWLTYFAKSNKLFSIKWKRPNRSVLLKSIKGNSQEYFISDPDLLLFKKIMKPSLNRELVKHLAVFPKDD